LTDYTYVQTNLSVIADAQYPLDPFPCSFPLDGEVANLLQTCYGEATGKLV